MQEKKQIVKLTGLPVSDKMQDILKRLAEGRQVSMEEIERTEELLTARSCINNSTPTIQLLHREKIQENAYRQMMEKGSAVLEKNGRTVYNGEVVRNSRLDIIIGLPASGKSSAIVDTISNEFHSHIIDNDEVKKLIPEFNNGWGAGVVHEESQRIADEVFSDCMKAHENIVLPKVGSDVRKLKAYYIGPAREKGYQVYVHYVDLDRNKALGRMLNRFLETGRFLDPKLIDGYVNEREGNRIAQSYEALKKGGMLDGYSKWNNDVGRGERPILIETDGELLLQGEFIRTARTAGNLTHHLRAAGRDGGDMRQGEQVGVGTRGGIRENDIDGAVEERNGIVPDVSGGGEKRISRDIHAAGFKPTESLVNNIAKFERLEGRHYSMRDLAALKHSNPDFKGHPEKKACFEKIVKECQEQEGGRMQSAENAAEKDAQESFLKKQMMLEMEQTLTAGM